MKLLALAVLWSTLAACEQPNANICCTDEADCAAAQIPRGTTCDDGLACRGHQCVALVCETAAACDPTAPICADNRCTASCTSDDQCPGFAADPGATLCEAGACVSCRADADCGAGAPICDAGACRGCTAHSECASGVCGDDGACAAEAEIAYVDPAGSGASECTRANRCSLTRGVAVTPLRRYVSLAAGAYQQPGALLITGARSLIGDPASPRPVLTRQGEGPVVSVQGDADVTLEHLRVAGARDGTTEQTMGDGVLCGEFGQQRTRRLRVRDVEVSDNARHGVHSIACEVSIADSLIARNPENGLKLVSAKGNVERSSFIANGRSGILLYYGTLTATNSVFARATNGSGIGVLAASTINEISYCTFIDNRTGVAGDLQDGATLRISGSVIGRNSNANVACTGCALENNLVTSDLSALRFRSPDVPPYDYHLTAGSEAIDAGEVAAPPIDLDGDARPQGARPDLGADEYVPGQSAAKQ